jgi:hypothetical protein
MTTLAWPRTGVLGVGVLLLSNLFSACSTEQTFSRPSVDDTTRTKILGNAVWTSSVEPHHYYCVGSLRQQYPPECSGTRYHLLCVCTHGNLP